MFKKQYTAMEREILRNSDDTFRARNAFHEMEHHQNEARCSKTMAEWEAKAHDYMLAQIATIEAIHDAVLISRADFERLCMNHAAPPVPVAGEMLFNKPL